MRPSILPRKQSGDRRASSHVLVTFFGPLSTAVRLTPFATTDLRSMQSTFNCRSLLKIKSRRAPLTAVHCAFLFLPRRAENRVEYLEYNVESNSARQRGASEVRHSWGFQKSVAKPSLLAIGDSKSHPLCQKKLA